MDPKPASASRSLLVHWMGVTDTNNAGFVHGGTVLKLADEVAGIAAARHCGCRVVTGGLDRVTFLNPIDLGEVPVGSEATTYEATGDLTLRGTTKPVTFELSARRNGANIEVQGSIPIVFEEWGIPNPSTGPISTEDNGELEFLVVFARD